MPANGLFVALGCGFFAGYAFVFHSICAIFALGLSRSRGDEVYFCGLNNSVCCLFDNNVPEVWPRKELHYRIKSKRPHSVDVELVCSV